MTAKQELTTVAAYDLMGVQSRLPPITSQQCWEIASKTAPNLLPLLPVFRLLSEPLPTLPSNEVSDITRLADDGEED